MSNTINVFKPSVCFEVQKIIAISTSEGNCKNYQVQWAPSWISGVHLIGCEDLIELFEHEQNNRDNVKVEEDEIDVSWNRTGTIFAHNDEVMQEETDVSHNQLEQQLQQEEDNAEGLLHRNIPTNMTTIHSDRSLKDEHHDDIKNTGYPDDMDTNIASVVGHVNDIDRAKIRSIIHMGASKEINDNRISKLVDTDVSQSGTGVVVVTQVEDEVTVDSHGQFEQQQDQDNGEFPCQSIPNIDFQCLKTNITSIQNRESLNEKCKFSFQSDQVISDNIEDTGRQDTAPSVVDHTAYVNIEDTITVIPSKDIDEKKIQNKRGKKIKTFRCNICNKVFTNCYKRNKHTREVHGTHTLRACNICNITFRSYYERKIHVIRNHSIIGMIVSEDIGEKKIQNNHTNKDEDIDKNKIQDNHISKDKERKIQNKRSKDGNENTTSTCDICNKTFSSYYKRKIHAQKIHSTLACDICNETFSSYYKRKRHVQEVHGTLTCDTCNKTYNSYYKLKAHTKKNHSSIHMLASRDINKNKIQNNQRKKR